MIANFDWRAGEEKSRADFKAAGFGDYDFKQAAQFNYAANMIMIKEKSLSKDVLVHEFSHCLERYLFKRTLPVWLREMIAMEVDRRI